jgi:hypothetical protein
VEGWLCDVTGLTWQSARTHKCVCSLRAHLFLCASYFYVSLHKMPAYSWRCFVCESVNEAGIATCSCCGFPARATGSEIEHARKVRAGSAHSHSQPAPDFTRSIQAALAPLPLYRKIPAVIGGLLAFAGVVWFKITFSWAGIGMSLLTFGIGVLVFALAYYGMEHQEISRDAG